MNNKIRLVGAIIISCLSIAVPLTAWSYGQEGDHQGNWDDGNGDGDNHGWASPTPTATPNPTATPSGSPTASPSSSASPTATPTPNPLTSGPPADETSTDNRYVTVELESRHPAYSNRGYQSTDVSANSLVHFSARLATFRGFYTGSNRGSGSNPPSTQPVSSPPQLTQAPTPAPSTPTPSPGTKVRVKKTAKKFADEGNDHNYQSGGGDH
jgi:hypothetical protein